MGRTVDPVSWITGLVLEAAAIVEPDTAGLTPMGSIGSFTIFGRGGQPLVETDVWRLYVAKVSPDQLGLMKISVTPAQNAILEHEVEILQQMSNLAESIDEERRKRPFWYGAQFPRVVDTIAAGERISVFLGYHPSITNYRQFVPMPLVLKDQRTDLQSTVWILGKTLRILDFAHRLANISVGQVHESNILLETDQHGIFIFDWGSAKENPSENERLTEVVQAVRIAWQAAGGTETTQPPHDPEIMSEANHQQFVTFLQSLMEGSTKAIEAHSQLYELANLIWPKEEKTDEYGTVTKRPFHHWVTYPR